jgi:hypothetical protein
MSFALSDIQSDVKFLVFGNSSETSYGSTDLNRNINRWYQTGIAWVLEANGDWQVQGTKATANIVAEQRDYSLPTNILKINEVYIKYEVGGDYYKARQKDPHAIELEPDQADVGYYPETPEYDIQGNSIYIYIPNSDIVAVTAGLRIFYQKNITDLSGSSDAPNLAEPFIRLLTCGAAYDYCLANELNNKAEKLKRDIAEIKQDLLEFYSTRSTAREIRLIPNEENYY